ncbi:sulfur carrier protein ThiS adenylyltransferase ThiF [Caldicellulosiruptoraceae bacterium PP1]
MNNFSNMLLRYFTQDEIQKIQSTKILIIGCGGLGSNLAHSLVRCGFLNITLTDFDKVEISNLNRQFYFLNQIGIYKTQALKENLLNINPECQIETINGDITKLDLESIIKKYHIVAEALDKPNLKKYVFEVCIKLNKKVVCASGVAGYGNCENIKITRGRNYVVIGDFISSIDKFSPLSPKVMAISNIQADEVLRMVLI